MKQIRRGLTLFANIAAFSVLLSLALTTLALADPAVSITAPSTKSVLSGQTRVIGTLTDAEGITYAILYVDAAGRSVTNVLPLHFELDTRDLPNGAHVLKIEVFDRGGSLAISPELRVLIDNSTPRPRTAPAAPSLGTGKLVSKPAATAAKPATPAAPNGAPAATAATGKSVTTAATPAPKLIPNAKATPANATPTAPAAAATGTTVATTPTPSAAAAQPKTVPAAKPVTVAKTTTAGTATTPGARAITAPASPAPKIVPGAKATPATVDTTTTKSAGTVIAKAPAPASKAISSNLVNAPKPTRVELPAGTTATVGRTIALTVNGPLPKAGAPGAKAAPVLGDHEPQLLAVPLTKGAVVERPMTVLMDGKALTFTPEPYVINGHAMVVLRALLADTGSVVRWDNIAKQATAAMGDSRFLITPDQRIVLRNGEAITLTEPVKLTAGRLFLPVTAWRDLFDGNVAYDPATRQVVLSAPERVQAKAIP